MRTNPPTRGVLLLVKWLLPVAVGAAQAEVELARAEALGHPRGDITQQPITLESRTPKTLPTPKDTTRPPELQRPPLSAAHIS